MKTVLISGASRGIGAACAEAFAKRGGWNIVINCSRSEKELKAVADRLRKYKNTVVFESIGDAASESYVESLVGETVRRFGDIDVLINNAGTDIYSLTQDISVEEWRRIIDVNLTAPFLFSKNVIPVMLKNKNASIINISSVWGECGAAMETAYSASKGGLNAFTKALAKELGPSGIRVNAVSCGYIDTPMNGRFSKEDVECIVSETPLGRIGTPGEIGEAVYLMACEFPFMTGQIATLDGGWMMP